MAASRERSSRGGRAAPRAAPAAPGAGGAPGARGAPGAPGAGGAPGAPGAPHLVRRKVLALVSESSGSRSRSSGAAPGAPVRSGAADPGVVHRSECRSGAEMLRYVNVTLGYVVLRQVMFVYRSFSNARGHIGFPDSLAHCDTDFALCQPIETQSSLSVSQ